MAFMVVIGLFYWPFIWPNVRTMEMRHKPKMVWLFAEKYTSVQCMLRVYNIKPSIRTNHVRFMSMNVANDVIISLNCVLCFRKTSKNTQNTKRTEIFRNINIQHAPMWVCLILYVHQLLSGSYKIYQMANACICVLSVNNYTCTKFSSQIQVFSCRSSSANAAHIEIDYRQIIS